MRYKINKHIFITYIFCQLLSELLDRRQIAKQDKYVCMNTRVVFMVVVKREEILRAGKMCLAVKLGSLSQRQYYVHLCFAQ